jgi:hypothetical protein
MTTSGTARCRACGAPHDASLRCSQWRATTGRTSKGKIPVWTDEDLRRSIEAGARLLVAEEEATP